MPKYTNKNAQAALKKYLKKNKLVEATQADLDKWYEEALKGSCPVPEIKLDDWKLESTVLVKELYVYGPGMKNLKEADEDTQFCLLTAEYAIWMGNTEPSLEIYED